MDCAKTVSPNKDEQMIMANECDSDWDYEDRICETCDGDVVQRVSKERADEHVRKMLDPRMPSEEEVSDHYRFHIPYRNWCPFQGQGCGSHEYK